MQSLADALDTARPLGSGTISNFQDDLIFGESIPDVFIAFVALVTYVEEHEIGLSDELSLQLNALG